MATFHDIIGQEQIKEHLQNAISAKKISHAYIINGEKVFRQGIYCQSIRHDITV